jgi:hypothetical protein
MLSFRQKPWRKYGIITQWNYPPDYYDLLTTKWRFCYLVEVKTGANCTTFVKFREICSGKGLRLVRLAGRRWARSARTGGIGRWVVGAMIAAGRFGRVVVIFERDDEGYGVARGV